VTEADILWEQMKRNPEHFEFYTLIHKDKGKVTKQEVTRVIGLIM